MDQFAAVYRNDAPFLDALKNVHSWDTTVGNCCQSMDAMILSMAVVIDIVGL